MFTGSAGIFCTKIMYFIPLQLHTVSFSLLFRKWRGAMNINLQIKQNITSYNYVLVSTKILSRSKPFKKPAETQFSSSLKVSLNAYLSKHLAWLLVCSTRSSILKSFSMLPQRLAVQHSHCMFWTPGSLSSSLPALHSSIVSAVPAGWVPSWELGDRSWTGDPSS